LWIALDSHQLAVYTTVYITAMPNRVGRKPLDADSETAQVNVKMPARQLDALRVEAERRGCSVSRLVRLKLRAADASATRRDPTR
jgi:hypothetical protein